MPKKRRLKILSAAFSKWNDIKTEWKRYGNAGSYIMQLGISEYWPGGNLVQATSSKRTFPGTECRRPDKFNPESLHNLSADMANRTLKHK